MLTKPNRTIFMNARPLRKAKTKSTPSAIIERGEDRTSYGILAEAIDDRMTDDEFNIAMAALEDIWRACPEDLPNDLSAKHDHYLSGAKG